MDRYRADQGLAGIHMNFKGFLPVSNLKGVGDVEWNGFSLSFLCGKGLVIHLKLHMRLYILVEVHFVYIHG